MPSDTSRCMEHCYISSQTLLQLIVPFTKRKKCCNYSWGDLFTQHVDGVPNLHQKCSTVYPNIFSGLWFSPVWWFQFQTDRHFMSHFVCSKNVQTCQHTLHCRICLLTDQYRGEKKSCVHQNHAKNMLFVYICSRTSYEQALNL